MTRTRLGVDLRLMQTVDVLANILGVLSSERDSVSTHCPPVAKDEDGC